MVRPANSTVIRKVGGKTTEDLVAELFLGHGRERRDARLVASDCGPRALGKHGDALEGVTHRGGCSCALLFRGRCDLEQSFPAEVWRKIECALVLHHNCQNVRETLRLVFILEVDADVVKL